MGINGYPVNFNPSQVTLFNANGTLTNAGSRFLLQIYNRTGGGSGFPSVALGLIATGNDQGNALLLASDWNEVDTVANGAGVLIPVIAQGGDIIIWNFGLNDLLIYPSLNQTMPIQIDALGVNQPYSLVPTKMQRFRQTNYNQIRSTQLG